MLDPEPALIRLSIEDLNRLGEPVSLQNSTTQLGDLSLDGLLRRLAGLAAAARKPVAPRDVLQPLHDRDSADFIRSDQIRSAPGMSDALTGNLAKHGLIHFGAAAAGPPVSSTRSRPVGTQRRHQRRGAGSPELQYVRCSIPVRQAGRTADGDHETRPFRATGVVVAPPRPLCPIRCRHPSISQTTTHRRAR